ncbi:hypothetical protein GF325_03430 [Candidatus Bathyarchaeota archaeon]|nr:hypothetical protein [Candidatus Bathyarchaeota archaeon]
MVNTVGMFGKFLRKEAGFWRIKSQGNGMICYCKHNAKYGGIYAYIEPGKNGVKIITGGKSRFFDNFGALTDFLNKLEENSESNFNGLVRALYRNTGTKVMRTFAL